MPYSDPDPYARNLTIFSLAIIAFYWGDGQLDTEVIKLPLVNVTFNNTTFIGWMAVTIYFWVIIKYYLAHGFRLNMNSRDDLENLKQSI